MNLLSYILLLVAFAYALLAALNHTSRLNLIGAALASYFLSLLVSGARVFFVLALICLLGVTGCATTGTNANTADFWSSPAVQQEMAFLATLGNTALETWIESQTGTHGPPPPVIVTKAENAAAAKPAAEKKAAKRAVKKQLAVESTP